MKFIRRFPSMIACAFLACTVARGDVIWFCPSEPDYPGKPGPSDYYNLFSESCSSQWSNARKQVGVFKIYPTFLKNSTDAQLTNLFAYLSENKIALALEWGMLTWNATSKAGMTVEGYTAPGATARYVQRIKDLGGNLAYIAMDEPLFFGHYYNGSNAENASVSALAANVAQNIAQARNIFPDVIVGDIEPIGAMPSGWASTTQQWIAAYKDATGTPLGFFHIDMWWNTDWRHQVPSLAGLLTDNIPLGVIFNADGSQTTSQTWMEAAEVNIQSYNASGIVKPAHTVIQDWNSYPATVLPETSPTAFSYLVDYDRSAYATQPPPTPLYRLYDRATNRHFYTADTNEKAKCVAAGWVLESVENQNVYAGLSGTANLTAFYRLYNASSDCHFYTCNTTERANALSSGYVTEGVAGYVFAGSVSGGFPFYRAYNTTTLEHFYTTNPSEYNSLGSIFTKEGICCYLP